jgi:N-acetylglutamate synthase-like GNAT family acetyltransferase
MNNIEYRNLSITECDKLNEMNPSQYIGKAWREVDGKRQLIEINYHDTDWPEGYEHHHNNLVDTIHNNGSAIGAFNEDNKLIGFATVNPQLFGKFNQYALLDQLFITLDCRNQGIGKQLFFRSAKAAAEWGAKKLYICAGSSEETIAFYFAIGCKEAEEINQELYEVDPRDYQLEWEI